MTNFDDFLKKQLEDPKIKAEYDALDPAFTVIQAMIDARTKFGINQKDLSKRTGIPLSDIRQMETGNANPSVKTLQSLAAGINMKLKIVFIPSDR